MKHFSENHLLKAVLVSVFLGSTQLLSMQEQPSLTTSTLNPAFASTNTVSSDSDSEADIENFIQIQLTFKNAYEVNLRIRSGS